VTSSARSVEMVGRASRLSWRSGARVRSSSSGSCPHGESALPEEAGAYKNLKGIDYLEFMANFYSNSDREAEEFVGRARDIADLGTRLNEKAGTYSKGMTRKLLLARAL
jgi:ABC-type multidrug transport system ATPase subunit